MIATSTPYSTPNPSTAAVVASAAEPAELRDIDEPERGVPGVAGMHDLDDYPDARPVPGLVVYRYDAPLFFANAEDFRERALAAVAENPEGVEPVEWFVLNAEANVEVDLTAVDALDQLRRDLEARGIVFAMARVKQDLRALLDAAGLVDRIGENRIFMTLPTAVEAFHHRDPRAEGPSLAT